MEAKEAAAAWELGVRSGPIIQDRAVQYPAIGTIMEWAQTRIANGEDPQVVSQDIVTKLREHADAYRDVAISVMERARSRFQMKDEDFAEPLNVSRATVANLRKRVPGTEV